METTASGAPLPPPCDSEIYSNGQTILIVGNVPSEVMEEWVKAVATASGERVDWHFVAGWAVVKALGDIDAARAATLRLRPELRAVAPGVQFANAGGGGEG
jgi:hypothetical protein